MPQVELTSQLAQLAECPTIQSVQAETLSAALNALFRQHDRMRQHILDEDGAIHPHLALFVNGRMIERDRLDVPLGEAAEIFVMQALSGG